MKCSICSQVNSARGKNTGIVPVSILKSHCYDNDCKNSRVDNLKRNSYICEDCCFEILMDIQWDIGWGAQAEFLYYDISTLYWSNIGKKQKGISTIYSIGTAALSSMCIKCNEVNELELNSKDIPEYLKRINLKYLNKYAVPEENIKDFGNLICDKCAEKYEKRLVEKMSVENLLLFNTKKFIFPKSLELYENRLRGN